MFCRIDRNYFTMERGDTFQLPLDIYDGSDFNKTKYYLTATDKVYVAILQPHESFENAIIRKVVDINSDIDECGNPLFILDSIDTEYLLIGKYFITAKLEQTFGSRKIISTILPMKEFFIEGTNKDIDENKDVKQHISVTKKKYEAIWEELDSNNGSYNEQCVWEKI